MNLESLKIFKNVVEAGGFSRAESRCGLTQSAISKQIQALENSLGHKLLVRSTKTLHMTEAGKLLYERTLNLINQFDETEQLLRGFEGELPPTLRIGTTLSIGISYFPGIFTNFTRKNPRCHLDVQVDISSELTYAVENRTLDCAVVCLPPKPSKNIYVARRFPDPLAIVASQEFVQKQKEKGVDLRDPQSVFQILRNENMILNSQKSFTRKIIDNFLFENGCHVNPVMELDSFDIIVTFVSLGLGLSIVPQRVFPIYARSRSIRCVKLAPIKCHRELGLIIHPSRKDQPLLQEFTKHFAF